MYNPVVAHESQRLKHLTREPANECSGESDEVVCLNQLVEVDTQEFHGNAQVAAEIEVLRHFNDMMLFVRILDRMR